MDRKSLTALLIFLFLIPSITAAASDMDGRGSFLKPGDIVRITIWRGGDLGGDFPVDEDGMLNLPLLGTIPVGEISTDSLKHLLVDGYSRYVKDPYITVVPLFRINVMGEVVNPGLYPVDATLGLSDLLSLAGGAREAGDMNRIRVLRDGEVVTKNLREELEGDRPIEWIGLRSGDQIVVGKKGGLSVRDWTIVGSMVSATAILVDAIRR